MCLSRMRAVRAVAGNILPGFVGMCCWKRQLRYLTVRQNMVWDERTHGINHCTGTLY